jgi:hypothetical protein
MCKVDSDQKVADQQALNREKEKLRQTQQKAKKVLDKPRKK